MANVVTCESLYKHIINAIKLYRDQIRKILGIYTIRWCEGKELSVDEDNYVPSCDDITKRAEADLESNNNLHINFYNRKNRILYQTDVDLSSLKGGDSDGNDYTVSGVLDVNSKTLIFTRKEGGTYSVDATDLFGQGGVSDGNDYVISGVLNVNNKRIELTRKDGGVVYVDVTDLFGQGGECNCKDAMDINNQYGDYTTQASDFNNNTLIRMCSTAISTDCIITRPPSEDYTGKRLWVRKVGNTQDSLLYLKAANDVTILPADALIQRREGNTVELLYIGNGVYDLFGEMPT